MKNLHFCGGLPRSGSTILMNILQQNPNIFTTGTCALPDLLHQHVLVKSRYREQFQAMSVEQADKAMFGFVQGATKGWFEALTNKPTIISKNRSWSNLIHLFKNSKYIVMVRDLRDIIESFERVNEKTLALHSYGDSMIFTPAMHQHEKFRYYLEEQNSLSVPLTTEIPRMMELYSKTKNKVLFIRYEDFVIDPIYMIKKIYSFIEEKYFEHDLDNIEQSVMFEHDHAYFREKTNHVTHKKFLYNNKPNRTLPHSFHTRVVKEFKWFYEGFYPNELKS